MAPNIYTRVVDAISEWLGVFAELLILSAVAIGFYNVVARYLAKYGEPLSIFINEYTGLSLQPDMLNRLSSNVFIELQWYLFSLVFFLGFSYILKNGINVRVDFLYTNFTAKRKALIDIVGHVLFLIPFCVISTWISISPVRRSWAQWEMSPDPGGLPRAPLKAMLIFSFGLLVLQAIAEVMKLWAVYRGNADPSIAGLDADAPIRIE